MGYYSDFIVDDFDGDLEWLQQELSEYHKYDWYIYDGTLSLGSAKWYSWQEDLAHLARENPILTFIVYRYGEEQPDISRIVVDGGEAKYEEAIINWPSMLD